MKKLKNIHYLYMFPKVEDAFNDAAENAEQGNVSEGFVKLRQTIEALEKELLKDNDWYKERLEAKNRPNSEECIKELFFDRKLTTKQVDLFNSIRWLANKYVHMSNDEKKYQSDLESLKNFIVRLDNELPSIMAHLGIGGASRFAFLNRIKNKGNYIDPEIFKNVTPETAKKDPRVQAAYQARMNAAKTSTVTYKTEKKDIFAKAKEAWDSLPAMIFRFAIVFAVFAFLVNILFINKVDTNKVNNEMNVIVQKENDYFNQFYNDFDKNLGVVFTKIGDFLKFE